MALSIKNAIALGLLGAGGVALAVSGARNLYKAKQANEHYEKRERDIRLHNLNHSQDYLMSYETYLERFETAIRYVHSYRYGYNPVCSRNLILMSQFALLLDEDVAILLAAGMASTHMFDNYSELFTEQKLFWAATQSRYMPLEEFLHGHLDVFETSFTATDLVDTATYIKTKVRDNKEYRVAQFIKEQSEVIYKLLTGQSTPEEKAA